MNNSRALLILFIFFAGFVMLGIRLFNIQIVEHEKFQRIASRQQEDSLSIKAERGVIKDRNDEVLAYTKVDMTFTAYTPMIKSEEKIEKISSKFSEVFGKSKVHYKRLLKSDSRHVTLVKKAPKEKALKLNNFVVDGLIKKEDYTRIYPYGACASHLIGFVDIENKGVSGVEKFYDEYLTGVDGLIYAERDVMGRIISIKDDLSRASERGSNVQLTIDKNYQRILEEALKNGLDEYGGNSAVGIVMDPNTGEILAMANLPEFEPAKYNQYSNESRRNLALTDPYEPGSTIKSIIMAMLLEEKLVSPSEKLDTENGVFKYRNVRIRDTHKYEKLSVQEIFEHSSNIGMAKLSERISDDQFYRYLRDFGFGNLTSVDLPGENGGFLKKPDQYSKVSKAFMSFGYEIMVTPLQLISAYSAIVNGGTLYKPYVVKKIIDSKGLIQKQFDPLKIRNVISKETSEKMRRFMTGVVENGTGLNARLNKVLVGGKTGTSQKLIDNKYSAKEYNSSFVGFFPANDPKIVCLILVNSPEEGRYGGLVAAPIFSEVASKIVEANRELIPKDRKFDRKIKKLDKVVQAMTDDVIEPETMITLNIGETKIENDRDASQRVTYKTMPDLMKKSKRDAVNQLTAAGIDYEVIGSGKVISQSIKPGTDIKSGQKCIIKCELSSNETMIKLN